MLNNVFVRDWSLDIQVVNKTVKALASGILFYIIPMEIFKRFNGSNISFQVMTQTISYDTYFW